MSTDYAQAPQVCVGIAAFDVATRRTRCAGCKPRDALIKVDCAVQGCVDLNDQDRIQSSHRFDSNPIYQDRIRSTFSTRIGSNLSVRKIWTLYLAGLSLIWWFVFHHITSVVVYFIKSIILCVAFLLFNRSLR